MALHALIIGPVHFVRLITLRVSVERKFAINFIADNNKFPGIKPGSQLTAPLWLSLKRGFLKKEVKNSAVLKKLFLFSAPIGSRI